MKVLLAGLTTRAAAESAVRAGVDVVTVDHFGDLDQKRLCENVSLRERGERYSAAAILAAARDVRADAVAYVGGLENHPGVVAELARDRELLGNPPEVLRRVRDPGVLFPFLAGRGFAVPAVVRAGERLPAGGRWLTKPERGGGGQGVRRWRGEQALPPGRMLQAFVDGMPGSVMFMADGRRATVLGWSEALHAAGSFRYGGNVLPFPGPPAAAEEAGALAAALAAEFGLRGVNGFDFVLADARPVLVEVNPRYCASMELFDRATGASVFAYHLAACRGALPAPARPPAGAWGKAVVYAPARLRVGDTRRWPERGIRDVPHPREVIRRGHPVCTVLASAADRVACREELRRAEADVLAAVRRPQRGRRGPP